MCTGLMKVVKRYFLSVRLSENELRAYIRLLWKHLGWDAYPNKYISKSEQFIKLLEAMPKPDGTPNFCDGRPLSEYYVDAWKVKP